MLQETRQMKGSDFGRYALSYCVAAAMLAGCGVSQPSIGVPGVAPQRVLRASGNGSSKYIKHIVVMIQENRSFDNFFATFPNADGAKTGKMGSKTVKLREVNLYDPCDWGHSYKGFVADYDGGKMDGFAQEGGGGQCPGEAGRRVYAYVNPEQLAPDWDIATQYVLADHMFQTQGSGSFTAHQDLIRGGTMIDQAQTQSLVDFPTATPWGCDAPASTKTYLLVWTDKTIEHEPGPFPCTNKFPGSGSYYPTLRDRLDAKSVSWKYYSPPVMVGEGKYWNAFDMIAPVRYGPEWTTNVTKNELDVLTDISSNKLPAMSWVIPDATNSDHPGNGRDTGPSWIADVVNAVGGSPYWSSTAIIVVWDDWGGWYDHVPPPSFDHWGGLGFRVPMMVISPYARETSSSEPGYISHTQYEFGSIIKFIEQTWGLRSLGTTDQRATSILDCFDFTQQPRSFTAIPSKYPTSYFLHEQPSNEPVDTQ
jgi:phospholipase C